MMGEQERYPPPSFSWSPQQLLPHTLRFEAARDWSWTRPAPAGPWSTSPGPTHLHGHQHTGQRPYSQRGGWQDHRQQWGRKKQNDAEFSHFCDTCEKGFKNQHKYDEHISQHVKCSVKDCNFTAHEKLVKIHWRNSHAPGTKRIKLDTPDEIARWREERRKNYPTLSNVEKKVQMMEVKHQRGDVLETAQFGRIKSRGRGRGYRRGCGRGRGFNRWGEGAHETFDPVASEMEPPTSLKRQHQDEDPLGALANSDPGSDKEESVQQKQTGLSVAPRSVTSALGSLMSSYGDDMTTSESEGDTDDSPVLKVAQALEENKVLLVAQPVPVQSSTDGPQQSHHAPAGRGRGGCGRQRGKGHRGGHSNLTGPHQPTLLEMLLAPDIRHERNVILQCARYIVRKGFFGLAGKDRNDITTVTTNDSVCEGAEGHHSSTDENITRDEREHSVMTSQSQEELNNASHSVEHAGLFQRSPALSQHSETSRNTSSCDVPDESVNETGVISAQSPDEAERPSVFLQLFAESLVCEDPAEPPQSRDAADVPQETQSSSAEAAYDAEACQRYQEDSTINTVDQ